MQHFLTLLYAACWLLVEKLNLRPTVFWGHHRLPGMSRFTSRVILAVLMARLCLTSAALIVPGATFAQTSSPPTACHEECPLHGQSRPMAPSHDCCLVGHNHSFPSSSPELASANVASFAPINLAMMSARSHERRRPIPVDSGPPSDPLPLRI